MNLATRQDLRDLTGYRRPSRIAAMLGRLHVPYVLGRDGWPRVAQAQVDRLLDPRRPQRDDEPDFTALATYD